ncbi:uncharacterized protein PAF06_009860 [Gastrophryne carolinensis]
MEKQQLSVDDDLLPIYYVHSDVRKQTFSSVWQGQDAAAPSPSFNYLPSFTETCLPPAPARTERPVLNKYEPKTDETKSLGFTPGTDIDFSFVNKDYSKAPKEMVSARHQSLSASKIKTQVSTASQSSSAQDVFLSSLLQVQLCVMDLQDQIDITETSHKAKEIQLKKRPQEPAKSHSSIQGPEVGLPAIQRVDEAVKPQELEEDQEGDDTAYSDLEVEDEGLFCDNPLFKNSDMDNSLQHTTNPTASMEHKPAVENMESQGSQLLNQNVWNSTYLGTRTAVWPHITREESLEELQIYEDEWEENRMTFSSTRTSRRPAFNNLTTAKETPLCLEDPPANITKDRTLPDVPVISPNQEILVEETGLLFSESNYWTKFLTEDSKSVLQDQPPPNGQHQPPPYGQHQPPPNDQHRPPPYGQHRPPPYGHHQPPLNDQHQPPPNGQHQPPPYGQHQPPPNDQHQPPPNGQHQPPPNGQAQPPPNGQHKPPPNGQHQPPPNGQAQPPRNGQHHPPPSGQNPPPPNGQNKPPHNSNGQDRCCHTGQDPPPQNNRDLHSHKDQPTPPTQDRTREEILLELCQDKGLHGVCQGCQGKEHRIQVMPLESTIPEMQPKEQLGVPEIVLDQLDAVSTDLETSGSEETSYVEAVASSQDVEAARCLALKLFHLDGFERDQVAPYLQKNNDFSAMVAEEYLALFDFTGKSLDVALRSLLQELVLTGETQERERVLYHFSKRFHASNPKEFSSADAVHTLTCALMLLNSDLHGQNIGKNMTAQEFVSNLEGMNDGGNFPRELLKALYHSIRMEKLQWAVSEEKLTNTVISRPESLMSVRKKSNAFVDIPSPDPQAPVYKQGMLCRKIHAAIDGKKTPWGKRRWKSFHIVLKGTLLFSFKDEYRVEFQFPEEVISIHHALAERASDYTKRPNVFRLQTADWRVFLFQAQTSEEMNSWISRINLIAAMFSSPPFPSAVGSQRRFYRPILPSAPSKLDLEEQLQSHESLMDRFTDDLTEHQRNLPDPKSKSRDWEDYHLKEEYLRHEKLKYETYVKLLAVRMESSCEDLQVFESRLTEPDAIEGENGGLKRSYSSPSLNPENSPLVKVKRNISERRTYRRIIPKRNKNLV